MFGVLSIPPSGHRIQEELAECLKNVFIQPLSCLCTNDKQHHPNVITDSCLLGMPRTGLYGEPEWYFTPWPSKSASF